MILWMLKTTFLSFYLKESATKVFFLKNFEKTICAFREVSEKRVLNPKITLFFSIYTPQTLLDASQDAILTFPIQKLPSWEASSKVCLMYIERERGAARFSTLFSQTL